MAMQMQNNSAQRAHEAGEQSASRAQLTTLISGLATAYFGSNRRKKERSRRKNYSPSSSSSSSSSESNFDDDSEDGGGKRCLNKKPRSAA